MRSKIKTIALLAFPGILGIASIFALSRVVDSLNRKPTEIEVHPSQVVSITPTTYFGKKVFKVKKIEDEKWVREDGTIKGLNTIDPICSQDLGCSCIDDGKQLFLDCGKK